MLSISSNRSHRCGILFGLHRTSKTFLLYQWLSKFTKDETAYISVASADELSNVLFHLDILLKNEYRYVALDEITLCSIFIYGAMILSDKYASWKIKLCITKTDSLVLSIAKILPFLIGIYNLMCRIFLMLSNTPY